MTLQIRDPRAHDLARQLAHRRKVTMTEAVIQALEGELRRDAEAEPLARRIGRIAADLAARAGRNGRALSFDDAALWDQP